MSLASIITMFLILLIFGLVLVKSFSIPQSPGVRGSVTCNDARRIYRHVQCEIDGSYSPVQCKRNRFCTCVNTTTGNRVGSPFKREDRNEYNCTKAASCGEVTCALYCPNGYQIDRQGCSMCSCNPTGCIHDDVWDLIRTGCRRRCIERNEMCFNCSCNNTSNGGNGDGSVSPVRCNNSEVAVKRGYGWGTCRERLEMNDTCDRTVNNEEPLSTEDEENDDDETILRSLPEDTLALLSSQEEDEMINDETNKVRRALVGASARRASRIVKRPSQQCKTGYYCRKNGLNKGQCKPSNGPCRTRMGNSSNHCDPNGYYKPRYCHFINESGISSSSTNSSASRRNRMIRCVCVHPVNGTNITGSEMSFDDTGDEKENELLKPSCSQRVYGVCRLTLGGRNYTIRHGKRHINHCTCRICRCYFGTIYCTVRSNCTGCPNDTNTCTFPDGTTVNHGTISTIDCNRCICRFGRTYCSDRDCNNTNTSTNNCTRCLSERINKVCAPNGKTYINRCFAIYCAGVASVDLLNGPCSSIDFCRTYSCQTSETCLRRRGVSCLSLEDGCSPDTLRYCVNVTDLECDNSTATSTGITRNNTDSDGDGIGDGDVDPSDTSVCASDGVTYSSTCHLLQNTVNVHVVHAGSCNASQCRGGQVCGTDGVTYDNICALRTQSDNARFDYRGPCVNDTNMTATEMCTNVRDNGKCRYNITNCPNCLVQPVVGCCPICGGAVLAILDREGVSNASAVDSDLATLDGLLSGIVNNNDVFLRPSNSCAIEASLTAGGNIEFIMTPRVNSTSCYCGQAASNMTSVLNGTMSSTEVSSTYQYLLGATEARALTGKSTSPGSTQTGSGCDLISFSPLLIFGALMIAVYN